MQKKVKPVLLAGGNGKRLWPLSRKSYPKQFIPLIRELSALQHTAKRIESSKALDFDNPLVITSEDFRFIVTEQLKKINVKPKNIMIEPRSKNTAPAILLACLDAIKSDIDSILLVLPTDHEIVDFDEFHYAIKSGWNLANQGYIVTFGMKPTRPETGYGYIEVANLTDSIPVKSQNFIEKPSLDLAKKIYNSGNHLWNSGIFLFKASELITSFNKYENEMLKYVQLSLEKGTNDLNFFRPDVEYWKKIREKSIDYAIMEKVSNSYVVPCNFHWSDLGGWDSVWQEYPKNNKGVVTSDSSHAINCRNVLLLSEDKNTQLVGLGLENLIAIATSDAVLVADKSRSQDVKQVVDYLSSKNIPQAESSKTDHRPWGWFEVLILSHKFQVKRIHVNPRSSLSLQSHKFRSEHWVVVKGTAKVTLDGSVSLLNVGESTYIKVGSVHRLENVANEPLEIIEVQTGSYLGEDDIIRYQDNYSRSMN